MHLSDRLILKICILPANPYSGFPKSSFWSQSVRRGEDFAFLNDSPPKFEINKEVGIATAGSCFAQHIGRTLRGRGFKILDFEPPPPFLPVECRGSYGYEMYSAKYGNVYTSSQLLQLAKESFGMLTLDDSDLAWIKGGRFYDACRPNIEPNGFSTIGELRAHRIWHLSKVKQMLLTSDVFIFTLGLTECWINRRGIVYPTAPGVIAGEYLENKYSFKNLNFTDVCNDLQNFLMIVNSERSKNLQMLLTVSPVPLVATATGDNVLVASSYSKSVLRAASGYMRSECIDVDYFPSYELISNPWFGGSNFEIDFRSIKESSVAKVMDYFMNAYNITSVEDVEYQGNAEYSTDFACVDIICEELLNDVFVKINKKHD